MRLALAAVLMAAGLVAAACRDDGGDSASGPNIPIQAERPRDAQGGVGPTPTGVSGAAQEPAAEPTPRDRVSMLLTPIPSPTVPPALVGLYGNPVPTPVPQEGSSNRSSRSTIARASGT